DACTADACTADACTADACTADACTADACTADACTADACTADACAVDACAAAVCAANVSTAASNTGRTAAHINTTAGALSPIMYPNRSGGYAGSSGTYAPPAFTMPSTPTTISSERSAQIPAGISGPTPRALR